MIAACELCGDGLKDPEEDCDDGNNDNGDGCRFDCDAVEPGWNCSDSSNGRRRRSLPMRRT